ncbi:MAG: hypothetical protein ACK4VO_00320 [Pseudobdellovibrio sp.]
MKKFFTILLYFSFVSLSFSYASDDHDHKKEEAKKAQPESKKNQDEHGHKDEESHDHAKEDSHEHGKEDEHSGEEEHAHSEEEGDEHGHGEENSQVGPDKGILEASEDDGIKLSPEAEKNFDIEKFEVTNANGISIEKSTLVTSGIETNLYRYRNGFYKRIDFKVLSKNGNKLTVASKDLSKGDSIVTKGSGFILIAEIAAFGGAPEGHSH